MVHNQHREFASVHRTHCTAALFMPVWGCSRAGHKKTHPAACCLLGVRRERALVLEIPPSSMAISVLQPLERPKVSDGCVCCVPGERCWRGGDVPPFPCSPSPWGFSVSLCCSLVPVGTQGRGVGQPQARLISHSHKQTGTETEQKPLPSPAHSRRRMGNTHPAALNPAENAKKRKRGTHNALYMPRLAKPRASHTSRHLPALVLQGYSPNLSPFTQLGVVGAGGRLQLDVKQAESISRFPFTLLKPHLVFVSAADTSSEMHPSLLD